MGLHAVIKTPAISTSVLPGSAAIRYLSLSEVLEKATGSFPKPKQRVSSSDDQHHAEKLPFSWLEPTQALASSSTHQHSWEDQLP